MWRLQVDELLQMQDRNVFISCQVLPWLESPLCPRENLLVLVTQVPSCLYAHSHSSSTVYLRVNWTFTSTLLMHSKVNGGHTAHN